MDGVPRCNTCGIKFQHTTQTLSIDPKQPRYKYDSLNIKLVISLSISFLASPVLVEEAMRDEVVRSSSSLLTLYVIL